MFQIRIQAGDVTSPIFGNDAPRYALAWLLSQQRASPTKGMTDVLRAADMAKGKPEIIMTLNAERKLGRVVSCISGDFIADMTPCAPNALPQVCRHSTFAFAANLSASPRPSRPNTPLA